MARVSHNCQTLREEESGAESHTGAYRAGMFLRTFLKLILFSMFSCFVLLLNISSIHTHCEF